MHENISFEKALELIGEKTARLGAERVSLDDSLGRALAEDITAPISQPPFDRSPLDGYALRSADLADASGKNPVRLEVIYTLYAGDAARAPVMPGQAVRIMTGAMLPEGCDCVVRQESTDMESPVVSVYQRLKPWENYCYKGEDYNAGDLLLPSGTVINAAAAAVLAGAGIADGIPVLRRGRFAVLSTGDEIVEAGASPLPPGKIYSSNAQFISSRLRELGVRDVTSGLVGDTPEAVSDAISHLLETHDAVITTGGVSVGAKDILHDALPLLGAERVFWGVMMKPGSPAMFSLFGGKPVLSLSGNPFAAAATFELLARPMLAAMSGEDGLIPKRHDAVLSTPFKKASKGRRFIRGRFENGLVSLPQEHSSGVLSSLVGCNCLIDIPAGSPPLKAGEAVSLLL